MGDLLDEKQIKKLKECKTPLSEFVKEFKTLEDKDGIATLERVNSKIKEQIKLIQETPGKIAEQKAELVKLL